MMPTIQAIALSTSFAVGPPSVSARAGVRRRPRPAGCLAKPCSQPGIVLTGTNADDANTSGARIGNDAACAVSASGDREPDDREDPRQRVRERQHDAERGEQPEHVGADPSTRR